MWWIRNERPTTTPLVGLKITNSRTARRTEITFPTCPHTNYTPVTFRGASLNFHYLATIFPLIVGIAVDGCSLLSVLSPLHAVSIHWHTPFLLPTASIYPTHNWSTRSEPLLHLARRGSSKDLSSLDCDRVLSAGQ